jgi:hypothetical protein
MDSKSPAVSPKVVAQILSTQNQAMTCATLLLLITRPLHCRRQASPGVATQKKFVSTVEL